MTAHICTIETRLQHWARWKLKSGEHLGYKNKASFLALLSSGNILYSPIIDAACQEVNNAVEDLPTLHQMLIRHEYLVMTTEPLTQRAELFGMKKSAYCHWLKDAYKRLSQSLNIELEKPEEMLA
jgi:hypothetical protein